MPKVIFSNLSGSQLTHLTLILLGIFLSPNLAQVQQTEIIRHDEKQDEVTLRIKVTDTEKRPVTTLTKSDFKLKVTEQETDKLVAPENGYSDIEFRFKTPLEAKQPPAYILVLLDMSGSMKCSTDLTSTKNCDSSVGKGKRKFDAAISALKTFIETAKERGGDTKVAIVPFGYGDIYQPISSQEELDEFYHVSDVKHINKLDNLSRNISNDATNIYHSLGEAVKFLTNPSNEPERFYPKDEEGEPIDPLPRLAIILLTDGFDNDPKYPDKVEKLKEIKHGLQGNEQITIHTLGYGLTPEEIGRKFNLGRAARLSDTRNQAIAKEYLDVEGLEQISQITPNGLFEISGDANKIADKLQLFLDAILGEYEIIYTHPNPERARQYQVIVSAKDEDSEPKQYRVTIFGRTVPFPIYLGALGLLGLLGGAWFIPYSLWKNNFRRIIRQ